MPSFSKSLCLLAVFAGTAACTTPPSSPELSSFPSPESACIQRTAEEMVVRTDDIAVVATGPVDPENGVRVLSMRNIRTGNTADCFYNEIDQQVTRVELTGDSPALSPEDACIQRTAEEMVIRTADIMIVATGPVDPENGVRVFSMRNTVTGNTADCFYNEIDQQVTRVQLTGDSPALSPEDACIQRTAEEMVVRTADIMIVATGPVDPENGVRVLSMRNTVTGNTADCFYNEVDQQVTRVELTGASTR